ncbi:tRNA uridine 5-carboxymethylaminomethyl modification enzyme [Palleronia aestuarii]|uniref:tRNA uridine 5-carboxymethylaminomethyl modification enzyme MnmG n=2 Tax=Palleronia aestuarii TaxID=568105 RepID=A0A2W7QB43_9RHOB|nr:tRNA uridine 5-carboxymethylaminomethyl modification enzyme [Palleronia aestuarii]
MALCADKAAIHYRLLNRSKGPAVHGPRAQVDRELYRCAVQETLRSQQNISIIAGTVEDVLTVAGRVCGVKLEDRTEVRCNAVILTTGTFLNGVIHMGRETRSGGRIGDRASNRLSDRLKDAGTELGRLKTGTPPRIVSSSIDWASLQFQNSDPDPTMLSFQSKAPQNPILSCGITATNSAVHEIIASNLAFSAMHSGAITGKGPRYCPSVEDKISRFAEKSSHQIFLEPEGLNSPLVYPNGISTSLPLDIQREFVRAIEGLARAEIAQPGYAIEYDYVDPRSLDTGLQVTALPGLWLAGQINGTTGYEEAAAQGLAAAIDAVLVARGLDQFRFSRTSSYIGVLIDDLVTKGVSEPYRMFTSRAEYRLTLRPDNADQRLTPAAEVLGLVSKNRFSQFEEKLRLLNRAKDITDGETLSNGEVQKIGGPSSKSGKRRSVYSLLSSANIAHQSLKSIRPVLAEIETGIWNQLRVEALYSNYIDRQSSDILRLKRFEDLKVPKFFNFSEVAGLSHEITERLLRVQPESIGQASRIEGMTPVALNALIFAVRNANIPA